MIHFVPDSERRELAEPYAEAVARLAGLRQALNLVEGLAGQAPTPANDDGRIVTIAGEARRDWFDLRSAEAVSSSSAGLEAIAALGLAGNRPHRAAAEELADHIRGRLEELGAILSL